MSKMLHMVSSQTLAPEPENSLLTLAWFISKANGSQECWNKVCFFQMQNKHLDPYLEISLAFLLFVWRLHKTPWIRLSQPSTHTPKRIKKKKKSWKLPVNKKVWNQEALVNLQAYSTENYTPRNFPKDSLSCYSVAVQEKFTPKSTK